MGLIFVFQRIRVKMNEDEKLKKFIYLARELKTLGNIKIMLMIIVFGALGTIPKYLEKRLGELETWGMVETF